MRAAVARLSALLLAAVVLAACVAASVNEARTGRFAGADKPVAQRAAQVTRAARGLGWATTETAPGRVAARLTEGERRASIEITFDAAGFAIRYVDSANLHYDGKTIDGAYHDWIDRLARAIVVQSTV